MFLLLLDDAVPPSQQYESNLQSSLAALPEQCNQAWSKRQSAWRVLEEDLHLRSFTESEQVHTVATSNTNQINHAFWPIGQNLISQTTDRR